MIKHDNRMGDMHVYGWPLWIWEWRYIYMKWHTIINGPGVVDFYQLLFYLHVNAANHYVGTKVVS